MSQTVDGEKKRRATNVTLPVELVTAARELGVNVSQACERGLKAEVSKRRGEQWLAENREALESSNEYFERYGIPLLDYQKP